MKNEELRDFDNSDWLTKERIRESRISAWDLDEGRKVRNEHAQNCDVDDNVRSHRLEHVADDRFTRDSIRQIDGKNSSGTYIWFMLDVALLFVLIFVNGFLGRMAFFPAVVVLFLGINPGIFIWLFFLRRFPSERYSKTLFYTALILQILGFLTNYFSY